MPALLLLDLDNTLADREGAFLAWARVKAREWAPTDPNAVAYLVEQDDDGMSPRHHFFSAVGERFRLQLPVETLVADYRRQARVVLLRHRRFRRVHRRRRAGLGA